MADSGGNVYVTGSFTDTATFGATTLISAGFADVFVAKLTPGGTYQWAVRAGGIIGFGATTLLTHGNADLFVAKLNPTGAWQWATGAGGTGDDIGAGLAVAPDGAVCLTGTSESPSIAFGPTVLTNPTPGRGNYRLIVAKLAPPNLAVGEEAGAGGAGVRDAFTRLYPNPAHETVRLTGAPGATATLFDGYRRVVRTAALPDGTATLSVRGLPAGVYACGWARPPGGWWWSRGAPRARGSLLLSILQSPLYGCACWLASAFKTLDGAGGTGGRAAGGGRCARAGFATPALHADGWPAEHERSEHRAGVERSALGHYLRASGGLRWPAV